MTAFRLIPERKPRGLLVRLFTGAPPQCDYSHQSSLGQGAARMLGGKWSTVLTGSLLGVWTFSSVRSCDGPLFRHKGCKHVSCNAHLALLLVADAICCPMCNGRVDTVEGADVLSYVLVKVNHACAHSWGYPVETTMRDLVAAGEAMRKAIGGNPCPHCPRAREASHPLTHPYGG